MAGARWLSSAIVGFAVAGFNTIPFQPAVSSAAGSSRPGETPVQAVEVPQSPDPHRAADQSGRFARLDSDANGVVTREEWRGSRQSFELYDLDGNNVVSRQEVEGVTAAGRFERLDSNRDGLLDWNEWDDDWSSFNHADGDGDMGLTLAELREDDERERGQGAVGTSGIYSFDDLDRDADGTLTWEEWLGDPAGFARLDRDRDGRLTRSEYDEVLPRSPSSRWDNAFEAGRKRGFEDGLAAGREDRRRNRPADPSGRWELQTADAGYWQALGPLDAYKAGYRESFTPGYREGYERRKTPGLTALARW